MGKTALATNIAFSVAKAYAWEPQADGGRKTAAGGVVNIGDQLHPRGDMNHD